MQLSYCGINSFGQFDAESRAEVVKSFTPVRINGFKLDENLKVSITWCYTAYASKNQLMLQGFLGQKQNSCLTHTVTAETNIKDISTCENFCLVLLENGKLYKILPKLDSILEEIKLDKIMEPDDRKLPPQKRSIFGEIINRDENKGFSKITHIASGSNITVAVDEDNRVFSIPSEIHRFPKKLKVKQLVCGFEHALLLNANGDIYTWGIGLRGQLGREELEESEEPVLLEALAGIKITHIAAGGWHSAAISAFGDLYVWGFNSDGQLSLGSLLIRDCKTYFLPKIVTLPACLCNKSPDDMECLPVRVFSGARHIVLEMKCGKLYSAGCNKYGQCGQPCKNAGRYVDSFSPMTLDREEGTPLTIYCGHWNTIIK